MTTGGVPLLKRYTTRQGDMWDSIAFDQMGSELQMSRLIEVNPEHRAVVVFSAGIELVIPDVAETATTNLPPWKSR